MPIHDPFAARFAKDRPLDPWQVSPKKFDFDMQFVRWIQKYLDRLECLHDVVSAKAWINKSKFEEERHDLCQLQWEAYQESLVAAESRSKLRALDGGRNLPDSDLVGADKSSADPVNNASVEPELPDQFRRLDGESAQDYRARMARIVSESIKKVGSWT